jgi:hypothetical protein
MKQTSLQGIANKAAQDKTYRFRNLFGMLTVGFLFWCWDFINRRASAGVDRLDAIAYEDNLIGNIQQLAQQVKEGTYRAKLVLRKWIPKAGGKLRPLGIPAIADKLLQLAVAKILEAIYEQDFLPCSYGYRPGTGAHKAIKDLTSELNSRKYHVVVEADIKGFFNAINHNLLMDMLVMLAAAKKRGKMARIDDVKRLSILVNKKGPITAPFLWQRQTLEWQFIFAPEVCDVQFVELGDTVLFAHQRQNRQLVMPQNSIL